MPHERYCNCHSLPHVNGSIKNAMQESYSLHGIFHFFENKNIDGNKMQNTRCVFFLRIL